MKFWTCFAKLLFVTYAAAVTVKHGDEPCSVVQDLANCSSNGLTYLPLNLFPLVSTLDASYNRLYVIQWPLPYFHLLNLNLSRNHIHRITYHAFLHLFSLHTLDLSFNNIKYFSDLDSNLTFYNTPQLVNLIIKGNPLKSLGTDALRSDSLRKLDVSECDIRNLDGETSLLLMPNLVTLRLEKNPLMKVDVLVSESVEELYLSETQLRYIKLEFYSGLPKLKYLDISKNQYLKSLCRIGTPTSSTLRVLTAEFCSLEYLLLKGFPNIKELYLKGNKIDRISKGDFEVNGRLTVVDLSFNWIHSIDPAAFTGMINLVKLDLSSNKVLMLDNALFPLSRLVYLNISNNPLFTIDGIEMAHSLSVLDASHCELSSIPRSLFSLGIIESVNLSRNSLRSLPTGMTSFTLMELDLGYNRLTEVDDTWFRHFPRLRRIGLAGNRLTEPFRADTLTRLNHVQLHLDDNPWRCNCGEERYRNFYKHLSNKKSIHSLTCHGPENVTGLSWESACFYVETEASVKRVKKTAWLPMLVGAITTLSIIIIFYLMRRQNSRSSRVRQQRETLSTEGYHERSCVVIRPELNLPSYEEALLMPKPKSTTKSSVDTQTHVTYLGSVRSLDARHKNTLANSPSSNSL